MEGHLQLNKLETTLAGTYAVVRIGLRLGWSLADCLDQIHPQWHNAATNYYNKLNSQN